jgi:hydrogenase small subunit
VRTTTVGNGEGAACSRRGFLQACALAAAAVGLPALAGKAFAAEVAAGRKPSVIWLHFQECTGCTESLLRTSHPDVAELILDMVSLDYHETLFAAAGHQIEEALQQAIAAHSGKFVLVVEGAIPLAEDGIYCQVGGKKARDSLQDCAEKAAAVIALGSCASWGGVASAEPNPTGATGVPTLIKGKPLVCLPGCPANPYNLLGTVLQFATYGTLPKLDEQGRPLFAYSRTIHEDCPRRPHFDAGRFATQYGDPAHREGHCLYKLGCKGPGTHANCSLQSFAEVPGAWPVAVGHPCVGCTEQAVGFRMPLHATIDVPFPTAPGTYAPIVAEQGVVSPLSAGVAGLVGGAILGAAAVLAKRLSSTTVEQDRDEVRPGKPKDIKEEQQWGPK